MPTLWLKCGGGGRGVQKMLAVSAVLKKWSGSQMSGQPRGRSLKSGGDR